MQSDSQVLHVPRRSALIDQLARANRQAWVLLVVEVLLIVLVGIFIDWNWVVQQPIMATIAIGYMVRPFGYSLLIQAVQKKTRIQDLRESTRFGQYDKHRLLALYRDTLNRLRLSDDSLSVYITAGRSINAGALHVGLGSVFKWFNGIFLNRQTLHKLEPAELQDIIGHELGHYYKHYLVIDRFRIVTLTLGSLLAIFAAQRFGLANFLGYFILICVPLVVWKLSGLPHARNAHAIEYLCDDFGAQVGGVMPSINGLLKLGQSAEIECAVLQQAILSKIAGNFNPMELVETVLGSIPYGHATRDEIEAQVNRSLRERAANQKMSLGGLFHYMWNSDTDAEAAEELEEQAKRLAKLQLVPRLDWESLLQDPTRVQFSEEGVRALVEMIAEHPEHELFRIPDVMDPSLDSHPPLKSRVLYLWFNRTEIESQLRTRV